MSAANLPPSVDISTDTKKAIIDALKKVIETYQGAGLLDKTATYQQIIGDPAQLQKFIEIFKTNRDKVEKLVIGKDKKPVHDDTAELICGVTLTQIQQLLIKTCAKKFFDRDKTEQTVVETVKTRHLLFFTKTEQVERKSITIPSEERKFRELSRLLAFDWQLPLLEAYKDALNYQQLVEIGDDLLALKSPEAIIALAQFEAPLLRKVKEITGQDFAAVLAERPNAIAGIAHWSRDMYIFYRSLLGPSAWEFFAREKSFFNVVASLDKPMARVYGDVLCYIDGDCLQEMQRLNIDKAGVLIDSLKGAFGNNCRTVLAIPSFAKDILRKLVDSLLHMTQEKDQLLVATQLTCKAIAPQVQEWLAKQRSSA